MKKAVFVTSFLLAGSVFVSSGFAAEEVRKFEDPVFKPKTVEPKTNPTK